MSAQNCQAARSFFTMTANVLQLQEVGDFEALNCLPPQNLLRRTKLHLTTEPPIFCRCCYKLVFFLSLLVCSYLLLSWCVGLVALLDFFVRLCAIAKNTNVPPNALAYLEVLTASNSNSSFFFMVSNFCFRNDFFSNACFKMSDIKSRSFLGRIGIRVFKRFSGLR